MRMKTAAALAATTWMLGLAACGVTDGTSLPETRASAARRRP
jgi:hypothetical protein